MVQIQVRRLLGYCPQFEALFELLTTREHLELYARIKGVPKSHVPACVEQKLHEVRFPITLSDRPAAVARTCVHPS